MVGLVKYARPTISALMGVFVHRQNRKALGRRRLVTSIGVTTVFAALLLALVMAMGTNKRVYVVHTGSMTPTIPSKSAVLVDKRSYHVGQVISFRENGAVVTHRFVGLNPDGTLITKGDANTTVDPWKTTRADVIGGVVAAPRSLGYWLMYLKNPLGVASVLFTVICIALIWSIASESSSSLDTSAVTADSNPESSTTERRHRAAQRRALRVAAYDGPPA